MTKAKKKKTKGKLMTITPKQFGEALEAEYNIGLRDGKRRLATELRELIEVDEARLNMY